MSNPTQQNNPREDLQTNDNNNQDAVDLSRFSLSSGARYERDRPRRSQDDGTIRTHTGFYISSGFKASEPKTYIRIVTSTLCIAVLVLNNLAGTYLPRGNQWDLLWNILFAPLAIYNVVTIFLTIHSLLTLFIDLFLALILATFVLVDGIIIISQDWHFIDQHPSEDFDFHHGIDYALTVCVISSSLSLFHFLISLLSLLSYRSQRSRLRTIESSQRENLRKKDWNDFLAQANKRSRRSFSPSRPLQSHPIGSFSIPHDTVSEVFEREQSEDTIMALIVTTNTTKTLQDSGANGTVRAIDEEMEVMSPRPRPKKHPIVEVRDL